jgi:hypothetical protein
MSKPAAICRYLPKKRLMSNATVSKEAVENLPGATINMKSDKIKNWP